MAALLLPLALALQTAVFALRRPLRVGLAREAFMMASVVVTLVLVATTELLSLGHWLSFGPVVSVWIGFVLILEAAVIFSSGGWGLGGPRAWGLQKIARAGTLSRGDLLALGAVAATELACLVVALRAGPNNFDSMTYHLPRVMHWLQNQSVAHYPAGDLRQLAFPPGASFFVLQVQLLAGSDRLAALPQWLAYVGMISNVTLIARALGTSRPARVLAAALAASLPMAVLQAQTTQNDLLTAYWLSCFVFFALKEEGFQRADYFWLPASLGLAILTKPTGLVFGAPLVLLVLARHFRRETALTEEAAAKHVGVAALILALALVPSLPHLLRNQRSLGALVPESGRTLKTTVGLRQTAACALKNAALEVPLPPAWSLALGIEKHVLRLDPEDPGNNFEPVATRTLSSLCWRLILPDEDFAGSPVHFLVLMWAFGALAVLLLREQEDPFSDRTVLMAALALGFLIFCAFFKWQEWANRLMLPLFVLAIPPATHLVGERIPDLPRKALLIFLACSGLFYAVTAVHRPLWALPASWTTQWQSPSILKTPRDETWYQGYGRTHEKPVRSIVETAKKDGCARIGLELETGDWEYPFWALLPRVGDKPVLFKSVHVANASKNIPPEFPSEELCGVVESQGGVIMYFDAADMAKMHAVGRHEPPRISEIRNAAD